jgi:hypothetical protein
VADKGPRLGVEGPEAIELEDQLLMSEYSLFVIRLEVHDLEWDHRALSYVFDIAEREGSCREKALSCLEVAPTEQEAKPVGGCTQTSREPLYPRGKIEALLTLSAGEYRRTLEGLLLDGVEDFHPGHGQASYGVLERQKNARFAYSLRNCSFLAATPQEKP